MDDERTHTRCTMNAHKTKTLQRWTELLNASPTFPFCSKWKEEPEESYVWLINALQSRMEVRLNANATKSCTMGLKRNETEMEWNANAIEWQQNDKNGVEHKRNGKFWYAHPMLLVCPIPCFGMGINLCIEFLLTWDGHSLTWTVLP